MKQNYKNRNLTVKIGGFLSFFLITTLMVITYGFKEKSLDLWKQLGIQQQEATSNIHNSFLSGFFYYYGARNIKNIAGSDKAVVTQNLLNYTKQFINTQFKSAYEKDRLAFKPQEPQLKTLRTKEQIQKEEVAQLEANIRKTEEDMKTMTEDMKKLFVPGIEQSKKMLAEYKRPGNDLFEMMAQGEKSSQEIQAANFKKALEEWSVKYPEDYKLIIKERLNKMLEVTKDVDFAAELKVVINKKKFVNPVYEAKRPEWKMAFRAGKEVTELTRAFAQQWLNEIK